MTSTGKGDSPVISLQGVTKAYGRIHALNGVGMTVERGELFGFLGPNGAGKTTTIRILTGFMRADAGAVLLFGQDAWRDSVTLKRRTGFVPDMAPVYGGLTGSEFLDYLARLHGHRRPPLQRDLLDRLQLSHETLGQKLKGYSHGMKQKVMLVQGMQHDPDLLIMDEPTDALDPLMRQVFFSLVRDFRDRGHTVLMSSHVLSDVEEVCGRVALIRGGRIVGEGLVEELRRGYTRTMWVEFREPPTDGLTAPGIAVVSRNGNIWKLAITGDINPALRELAAYDLVDLVFERTSLEELFMDYYQLEGRAGD
jgi:ABC-2 type transport system ATP-binding protein